MLRRPLIALSMSCALAGALHAQPGPADPTIETGTDVLDSTTQPPEVDDGTAVDMPAEPEVPAAPRAMPQALPLVATVPQPRDIPWTAGTIQIEVDATDTLRRIIEVRETIPVAGGGPLTLLLPQWLPGKHDARGEIEKIAGITITADGQRLDWQRDPLNAFAFHIAVPQGASDVVVRFQFLAPTETNQGRVILTESMANLQWTGLSLYPAGYYARRIPVQASVTLPAGWTAATALRGTAINGSRQTVLRYNATDYETLIDSPIFAGQFARAVDLGHDVTLNLFADDPAELIATPAQIAAHRKLVDEAMALFGGRHYDHYDFLLAISSSLGHIGLEHQRSSENQVNPGYFENWNATPGDRNILPHEFTHSWNGKFRRPELLWTPDFATPMQDDLLWVYEGQTQLWGYVLGARSGLYSKAQTLDALASIAGRMDLATGREWRPLADTADDPIIAKRKPKAWPGWQRSEDYYNEGLMIWLEADAIIQQQTGGQKSLDDFARAFFGVDDGDIGQLTYNRQDVIDALNAVTPYDWAGFLRERVDRTTRETPKGGFTLGGYRLSYADTPGSFDKSREDGGKLIDQRFGVGLMVANTGTVQETAWNSAAFKAGITKGAKIIAVNGLDYSPTGFRHGLMDAMDKSHPLSLIIKQQKRYRIITLDYSGGIRYPRLEKTGEGETSLDRLLNARTGGTQVDQPSTTGQS